MVQTVDALLSHQLCMTIFLAVECTYAMHVQTEYFQYAHHLLVLHS